MTASEREQLRWSLLRFLDANATRFGLPTDFLLQQARAEGRLLLQRPELEAELQYLADKGLVEEALKAISPERRSWRITANGRDQYASMQDAT